MIVTHRTVRKSNLEHRLKPRGMDMIYWAGSRAKVGLGTDTEPEGFRILEVLRKGRNWVFPNTDQMSVTSRIYGLP